MIYEYFFKLFEDNDKKRRQRLARALGLLRKVMVPFGAIWFIGLFIAGFLAYFVSSTGPSGPCDGLGRPLSQAPMLTRIFFGQEQIWAGWLWFAGDMALFWGSIALAINLNKWLKDQWRL